MNAVLLIDPIMKTQECLSCLACSMLSIRRAVNLKIVRLSYFAVGFFAFFTHSGNVTGVNNSTLSRGHISRGKLNCKDHYYT